MPYKKYPLLNKKNLKTIPIKERKSLVNVRDFGKPVGVGVDFNEFFASQPHFGAQKDLCALIEHMKAARKSEKPIILGMGACTVLNGLNPIIIELMERGWISALAVNGEFMIHDFEIAFCGETCQEMTESLHSGHYGNIEETGIFLNIALKEGNTRQLGAGEAVGDYLMSAKFPFNKHSILYKAYKLNIPVTIHSAVGVDFIHYHPSFDGTVAGAMADRDFLLFSSVVSQMSEGGIYLNVGSAYILPETFLNALSFCTAQGIAMKNFYTGIFDLNRNNHTLHTIVNPSILNGGKGYFNVGHIEIMFPLLAAALLNS